MTKMDWSDDDDDDDDDYGVFDNATQQQQQKILPSCCVLHTLIERGDVQQIEAIITTSTTTTTSATTSNGNDDDGNDAPPQPRTFNINERDRWGATPIHIAVLERNLECFELLLPVADLEAKCNGSPLGHLICAIGAVANNSTFAVDALSLLFDTTNGPSLLALGVDEYHRTTLRLACELGLDVPVLNILLNAVDKIATLGEYSRKDLIGVQDSIIGFSPLHAAVFTPATSIEALTELCSRGGSETLAIKDSLGRTALHVAAQTKRNNEGRSFYDFLVAAEGDTEQLDKLNRKAASLLLSSGASSAAPRKRRGTTQIFTHPDCLQHHTCPPEMSVKPYLASRSSDDIPPENVNRLRVLLDEGYGTLHSTRLDKAGVGIRQAPLCELGDILRVHDYAYVQNFRTKCEKLDGDELDALDGDTTFSEKTYAAALRAAGSACAAVDCVLLGEAENAFCAVRPPGHHAGPFGLVGGCTSHGFCFFNNVAIAAAYAMTRHRDKVKRVCIVDFDVHHGNGTEVCVEALVPSRSTQSFETHFGCDVKVSTPTWKPWLGDHDVDNVLFCSVHGFGKNIPGKSLDPLVPPFGQFYPGSGASRNDKCVVDVGQNSRSRFDWRSSWREVVLPRVAKFKPDLIIISAGFDAHAKDYINGGYCGALEFDYDWLTRALVGIANTTCEGRIVSVLEGGYRIQGKTVSAFARSVHDHVAVLAESRSEWVWDQAEVALEKQVDKEMATAAEEEEKKRIAERRAAMLANAVGDGGNGDPFGGNHSGSGSGSSDGSSNDSGEEEEEGNDAKPPPPVVVATTTTTTTMPSHTADTGVADATTSTRPKRRAAATIDFVKLNEEMEKEKAAKKAKMQQVTE